MSGLPVTLGNPKPERADAARNRKQLRATPVGPGAASRLRLIAYGRERVRRLIAHREVARFALDGRRPVPARDRDPNVADPHSDRPGVPAPQIGLGAVRVEDAGSVDSHRIRQRPIDPTLSTPRYLLYAVERVG